VFDHHHVNRFTAVFQLEAGLLLHRDTTVAPGNGVWVRALRLCLEVFGQRPRDRARSV
jgi:hypothetical protein